MYCSRCGAQITANAWCGIEVCWNCAADLMETKAVEKAPSFAGLRADATGDMGRDAPSSALSSADGSISGMSEQEAGPSGVGGWLLLLVVGMMFLGPLLSAGLMQGGFYGIETDYPGLTSISEWNRFKLVSWWAFIGFSAVSFYGGWGLVRRRDWSAVKMAYAALWISQPIASLIMETLIPFMVLGAPPTVEPQFFSEIIAAGIWTAYLSKSKRVRATYGRSA